MKENDQTNENGDKRINANTILGFLYTDYIKILKFSLVLI